MIILAIDPGDPAGWSIFIDGDYHNSGLTDCDVSTVESRILIACPDVLVLEDQYPGPKTAWKSLRTLMRRRFIWEIIAEIEGVRVVPVQASTWQGFFKLRKGKNSPPMVEQYSLLASALIGREVQGDEAAAVCIGCWGALNL